MSAFKQQYKAKRFGFGDTKKTRLLRSEINVESRKKQRAKIFNENRNIPALTDSPKNKVQSSSVNTDRLTRLRKWKLERDRRKKVETVKKRPPFIVGVVRHKIYSPMSDNQIIKANITRKKQFGQTTPVTSVTPLKRVTRATQKRLLTKTLAKETTKRLNKERKSITKGQKLKKRQEQSFAPIDYKFKAPAGLPHIPLFGRVVLESMSPATISGFLASSSKMSRTGRKSIGNQLKIENNSVHNTTVTKTPSSVKKNLSISQSKDAPNESASSSSHVISTSRKSNTRKGQQLKHELNLSQVQNDDFSKKDISVKDKELTAQHFQLLLNKEIDRLSQLCKKWSDIKNDATTTEDGQYEINQAIGQTNLLMNKKFQRFSKLITDCESGKGEMLVTCKDLQGFWDMMYMEINNCDTRFEKLEKLRSRNWVEEQSPLPKNMPLNKKRTTTRKKTVPTKPSSIRAFLAERKKYITRQERNSYNTRQSVSKNDSTVKAKARRSSMFLESKLRTPVSQKKTRASLLQKALSSAKSKSIRSPLTIMKVSKMCKTPDVQLDNTISHRSYKKSDKSILRQLKNSFDIKPSESSASKINFKPDEVKINAGKKLNFTENNFEECKDDKKQNFVDKRVKVSPLKTQAGISLNHSGSNNSLKSRNIVDENNKQSDKNMVLYVSLTQLEKSVEHTGISSLKQKWQKRSSVDEKESASKDTENIKILRNRIITSADTPKLDRSSRKLSINVQETKRKENKSPKKTRRSAKVEDTEEKNLWESVNKMSLNESTDKRKSRRSVKFSERNYTGGILSKPTLPMTPYIRRSKGKSLDKKKSLTTEDLISWETPQQPPKRVRKSRSKKIESLI
nr:PREDICTED: disks large-associated protein 5-like [Megachile rotundata]